MTTIAPAAATPPGAAVAGRNRRLLTTEYLAVGTTLALLALVAFAILQGENFWRLGGDAEAYYLAAERLRSGGELYPPVDLYSSIAHYYRYAPWLAVLFVPLTMLPIQLATGSLSLLALACGIAVLWPLARVQTYANLAALLFFSPLVLHSAWVGNIQVPMVAAVMYLPARWAWVAAAASLKFTPLVLLIPDAARGHWRSVILGSALCAVLTLPMLAFDLSDYATGPSDQFGLWYVSPWITIGLGLVGSLVTWWAARHDRRLGYLAAGATVVLASPYLILSYMTWLLIALRPTPARH
jgi:hypothetical protein